MNDYPHINESQTLNEAIEAFNSYRFGADKHLGYSRLFIINNQKQLVGELSLVNILHGLAPQLMEVETVTKFEGKDIDHSELAILFETSTFSACGNNRNKPVTPLMQPIKISLPVDTHILKALATMCHSNHHCIPITDNEKVIGILRLKELFSAMCTTYCTIK